MNHSRPLTLGDWSDIYATGVTPTEMLVARRRRLQAESPPELWISLADEANMERQLNALAERAASYDDAESLHRAMPLYGVPFAAKDNIDVAGFVTTAACPAFLYAPDRDASAVHRLVRAGAVCIGKTNLDQFATGLVGARSPYGRPSSAFDRERISGGSSSGSAVAVARGDVAFALGTDTAGSGRVPAGFNQIVGLKPTPGRVGTSGLVPACRSIDCVSIFALTVADAAVVLSVVEGTDPLDPYSNFVLGRARLPKPMRVAIPSHAVFTGDAGYGPAFESAIEHLRSLSHEVVPIDFASLHAVADLLYEGPWVAERHIVVEALLERDAAALDPVVRTVLETARGFSASDAFRGLYRLREAQRAARVLWGKFDLLMVPTAPGHPRHAEIDAEPLSVNAQLGTYTNFVNLLGWCALALPAGTAAHGLPFGVTFIAPAGGDAALARFGVEWQSSLDLPLGATGVTRPARPDLEPSPELAVAQDAHWPASEPTLPLVVVGAHLSGLPLNGQLKERGATLNRCTRTAATYRLFALPGTVPPKPGMVRVAEGGAAIEVEVWDMPMAALGSFLALVKAPLGLGSVELADGTVAHGFLCEAHRLAAAVDITSYGGWRSYLTHWRALAETERDAAQNALSHPVTT